MIPDVSKALIWLEKNSKVLKNIQRGLEREALRVNKDGTLALTGHPRVFGSALAHKWITTDFAEALLEFTTPVNSDIRCTLTIMRDIHRYTARNLAGNERIWPLSIPCYITQEQKIELAQYGSSNIGRLKTLYREGLKNRYGSLMQIISGVHYNFSLPITFWWKKFDRVDKETISEGYFCLIRNYYRFGWIIPYLFGASPAISSSFLQKKNSTLPFKKTNCGMYYLPYSTSLRLSDFCYANQSQNNLCITYNSLCEYVKGLKRAISTPLKKYQKIGLEKNGKRLQINSNILQIENELYTPIRPKRVTSHEETLSFSLQRGGVEYVEVRSLDTNFFSPIGIDEQQVRFLDLFMIWCVLADAPKMSRKELLCSHENWNRVILEGRKPGITLKIGSKNKQYPLSKIGKSLFRDLKNVAKILDNTFSNKKYQKVCDDLVAYFADPELTFSARILRSMIKDGMGKIGCALAEKYQSVLQNEPLEILTEADFIKERELSILRQQEIEKVSKEETFEDFLARKS